MRIFYRFLRFLSATTLFFFCWTYLSVWQVAAFAIEPKAAPPVNGGNVGGKVPDSSEDRFEAAVESIRENVSKAEEKEAKALDAAAELESVKAKKAEIDALDAEVRKEFAATEKKIKDTNLTREILDRHAGFVQNYNDNIAELKSNLDAIEKAKTRTQLKAALLKTKLHLEKVKAPKKHIPLDPNNLPHRTIKPKERAPRLKKEDFEKEFGPAVGNKGNPAVASAGFGLQNKGLESWIRDRVSARKPVQLAYNAPAGDIPLAFGSELSAKDEELINSLPDFSFSQRVAAAIDEQTESILLAQVTSDPPAAADLAETVEIQFTPEIRAKALELGYSPVRIYEWVRNNIEFIPTYGSIQGANMCLQTKQCNDFDTASLLIALLRASGVSARYVYGTVDVPIEKMMNWVGGFSDPVSALNLVASGRIPVKGMTVSGKIAMARMEHVWVEAWADYIPSRGAVQKQGDTWIPLDASYKLYDYSSGADMSTALNAVGFDPVSMVTDANNSASKNDVNWSATSVNTGALTDRLDVVRNGLLDYYRQNMPQASVNDILGHRTIRQQKWGLLPASLPMPVVVQPVRFSAIPVPLQHQVSVRLVTNDFFLEDAFNTTMPLPSISSAQITLSFFPATAADEQTADSYGGILNTPPYLLNMKAFLKVGGVTKASGPAASLGERQRLLIQFTAPGFTEGVEHSVTAGGYYAIAMNVGSMSVEQLNERKDRLREVLAAGQATKDDSLGQILYTWGVSYFLQAKMFEMITSRTLGVENIKIGSEGLIGTAITVQTLFGLPRSAAFSGFNIDVKRDTNAAFAKDGNADKTKSFMLMTGLYGSNLENAIFEETMKTQGVSAVKLLRVANDAGIPIFYINRTNVATIIPMLSLPAEDIQDLQNAVNAGKVVYAPQRTMNYGTFKGIGYLVLDPESGAGAYMISGGLGVLHGGSAAPDARFAALVTICNFVRDTLAVILSLAGEAIGVAADFVTLLGDTITGLINGTATGSEIALSLAIWAAATAFSMWLMSTSLPLILTAALYGGMFLGPIGAVIGAVVAVLLIVAIQVALYFLVKYLIDGMLLSWMRELIDLMKSTFAFNGRSGIGMCSDRGACQCNPAA